MTKASEMLDTNIKKMLIYQASEIIEKNTSIISLSASEASLAAEYQLILREHFN